jgi:hypothetical protein
LGRAWRGGAPAGRASKVLPALRRFRFSVDWRFISCPIELKFCVDLVDSLIFNLNGGDWILTAGT